MTIGRIAILSGIGLLIMVIEMGSVFLYMVVYGHLIDKGHEQAYYEAHAHVAAPYCSIIAGIPLMFATGWWVSHWWGGNLGVQSALIIWLAYFIIVMAIMIPSGASAKTWILCGIALVTKLAAVYGGAVVGGRPG